MHNPRFKLKPNAYWFFALVSCRAGFWYFEVAAAVFGSA
jgi:hypothetical protein